MHSAPQSQSADIYSVALGVPSLLSVTKSECPVTFVQFACFVVSPLP